MGIVSPSITDGFLGMRPKTQASTGFEENFRQSVNAAQKAQMGNSMTQD